MDRPGCFQTIPNEFVVRLQVLPQLEQRYDTEGGLAVGRQHLSSRVS